MRVSLKIRDVLEETNTTTTVDAFEEETLRDLLRKAKIGGFIDLERYYKLGAKSLHLTETLPWIIEEDEFVLAPAYDEVSVRSFLDSHSIADATVEVVTGEPHAGGPEWYAAGTIVSMLISLLANLDGSANFVQRILRRMRKSPDGPTALAFVDVVISREAWSAIELAHLLKVDCSAAKQYLALLGYEFDHALRIYRRTQRTGEIVKRILDMDMVDEGEGEGVDGSAE